MLGVAFAGGTVWSGLDGDRGWRWLAVAGALAAAVGVAFGFLLRWQRRWLLAPRPDGVSRLRVLQLTKADHVPDDPAERAALRARLARDGSRGAQVAAAVAYAVLGAFFVGSVVVFVVDRSWGWLVAAVVVWSLALTHVTVDQRRTKRRHRRLSAQLAAADAGAGADLHQG